MTAEKACVIFRLNAFFYLNFGYFNLRYFYFNVLCMKWKTDLNGQTNPGLGQWC